MQISFCTWKKRSGITGTVWQLSRGKCVAGVAGPRVGAALIVFCLLVFFMGPGHGSTARAPWAASALQGRAVLVLWQEGL